MLVEIGVADAYAIPWEFSDFKGEVDFSTYYQHPKYAELRPSQYTDDTMRSLATTMVMTSESRCHFDPVEYANAILRGYERDRRKGWSKRFQAFLDEQMELRGGGVAMVQRIKRASSNGALMGVLPVGYIDNTEGVKLAAAAQALATHSHETIVPAQVMALSAHYFIYDLGARIDLPDFLEEETGWQQNESFRLFAGEGVTMNAHDTARAVISFILDSDASLTELIERAIMVGGDTDSSAALAVGIASCSDEWEKDLPLNLLRDLDEGHGWEWLTIWDDALKRRFRCGEN